MISTCTVKEWEEQVVRLSHISSTIMAGRQEGRPRDMAIANDAAFCISRLNIEEMSNLLK